MDFTKDWEKDADYIFFDVNLKTDYLFHPGDHFEIFVEGNGQRILIPTMKYTSDRIGSIEGNLEIFTEEGLGESYISVKDFKFLGLVNLNGEAYNKKTTGNWEEYHLITSTTKWNIPQYKDATLNIPPIVIDAFIKNEKETDLSLYVNENDWDTFPAKVDLSFDIDSLYIPIKATIENLDLSHSDKLIPTLISNSSNLNNLILNADLSGDIDTLDPFKSEIVLTADVNNTQTNSRLPSGKLVDIDTMYQDNILNINKLKAPENITANGHIDFNKLSGDLRLNLDEETYRLTGNIDPDKNKIKSFIGLTLPTNEEINQYGTISINDNNIDVGSKILTYSPKGVNTSTSFVNALITPETNEYNQQRFNIEAKYKTKGFYLNVDGYSDLEPDNISSHYKLQAPNLLTNANFDINLNDFTESYVEAVSIFRQDKLFVKISNIYENSTLSSVINVTQDRNTLLKAEAEHKINLSNGVGLDGTINVNNILDYDGNIYLKSIDDFNNIYFNGTITTLETKLKLDGRFNMRDGKFGFLGDINSDFGDLHLLAGYVPQNDGFNVNVVGKFNDDIDFVIHSENISGMGSFITENEIIVNDEHKLLINSNIDTLKNIISIDRLDYTYINLKNPSSRLEEGYLTASLLYSPTKYNLDIDAYIMQTSFELSANLDIKNNYNTFFTDISVKYDYNNYRLMSRTDLGINNSYQTNAKIVIPGDIIDIDNNIRLSSTSLLIDVLDIETGNKDIYSLTGGITLEDNIIRENLLFTINRRDQFGFEGTINFNSLEEILIKQKIKLSEYDIYHINAEAGYKDSLFVWSEITKENSKDFYFKINAETKNFIDYGLNIQTGRQDDSLSIIADLSLLDNGFIYTDINFKGMDVNLEGKVRLNDNAVTINDFDIINKQDKLLRLDGNVYYGFTEQIRNYLDKKTPKPMAGVEFVAGDFLISLSENTSDKLELTARVSSEKDSYYSSFSTTINDSYRMSVDDLFVTISRTYSTVSAGDMVISSSFSPLLEVLTTNEVGKVDLGHYSIEGTIGNTPNDYGTIPVNIKMSGKKINTGKPVEVIEDLFINLSNTQLKASLNTEDNGYRVSADLSDIIINAKYKENVNIYASINDPSLTANISNNFNDVVIDYLGMKPFIEGSIYEEETKKETPFKAEGSLYLTEDLLKISMAGNFAKEDLAVSGAVQTQLKDSGIHLVTDNLEANINKDSIKIQGKTIINGKDISLNNTLTINEIPISLNGIVSLEPEYIYTPSLRVSSQDIGLDARGKVKLIDSGISTDLTVKAPIIDVFKINGDFVFKKGLMLNSVYLINKDFNFLLNGNVNLIGDELKTNIQADTVNTRYAIDGRINLGEDLYKGKVNLDVINLKTTTKTSFLLGGEVSLKKKNTIGLTISLTDTINPLLKVKGNVNIGNSGKKFFSNNLLFIIGKDIPIKLSGYVQTTYRQALDSRLKIDFNNDVSTLEVKSKYMRKFDVYLNYNEKTTDLKANSSIFIKRDGTIETETKIQMGENDSFIIDGDIIPRKTGISLSDFELYSTQVQKKLLSLNAKFELKGSYVYPIVTVFDNLNNQYKLSGKVNVNNLSSPRGNLTFNYNNDIEYEINNLMAVMGSESPDVFITMQSKLRFPTISKDALIDINESVIEINLPENGEQNIINFITLKMKGITSKGISIDDKTSVNMDINDITFSTSLYNNTFYIDLLLPSFAMNIINASGKTKTNIGIKLEEIVFNSRLNDRNGFTIHNISTFVQGDITNKNRLGLMKNDRISIRKSKIEYNGEKIKFDIPIYDSSVNDTYNFKGLVTYRLGSNVINFEQFQFNTKDLLINLTGNTYINQGSIRFDNDFTINETKGKINGSVAFSNTNDTISLGLNNLTLSASDIAVTTNGSVSIKGSKIKNDVLFTAFDNDIGLKGSFDIGSGFYLNQTLSAFDQDIDIVGDIITGDIIEPQLSISTKDFGFDLTGGFSFGQDKFKLDKFGLKAIEENGTTSQEPIFTTTGDINFTSNEGILLKLDVNVSESTYVVVGSFKNDDAVKQAVTKLNINLGEGNTLALDSTVNYGDDVSLKIDALYNNIEVISKGRLNKNIMDIDFDVIEIKKDIYDRIDDLTYEANYSNFGTTPLNTIVKGDISIDIDNNFESILNLKSELFTYDGEIAFTPNEKLHNKNYLIYTDGNFNLKDEQGGTDLKLLTAHRLSTEGYLADNIINVTLPDNSLIETGVSVKFENLWIYFNGYADIYSNPNQYNNNEDTLFSLKYDSKIAFSEKGVYGKLTANMFNTDLTYSGLVNFNQTENIVIDGSLKSMGLLFLVSGDIILDEEGIIKPDLKLYREDMDIRASGRYDFQSATQDVYLRGFFNDTPYELDFGLDGYEIRNKTAVKIPNAKTILYPKLEVRTWGERLLLLESVFTMSDEMLTYNALINDIINIAFRYNTPKNFILNVSHDPLNIYSPDGSVFTIKTNDFNMSAVDGNLQTRISTGFKDFIDSNGNNTGFKVNFAAYHNIKIRVSPR